MQGDAGFEGFFSREAPRLWALLTAVVVEREEAAAVLVDGLLVARQLWPRPEREPRPDLWLYAATLRMLRRPVGGPGGVRPAADVAGALRHLLGLGDREVAQVLDVPEGRVPGGPRPAAPPPPPLLMRARDVEELCLLRLADPEAGAALRRLAGAVCAYLDAERALRRDDRSAAEAGFAAAADAGFADAARRLAVVRRPVVPGGARDGVVDEDRLVAAAVAGDREALCALLAVLLPLITRYCRARTGVLRDGSRSPDDIAQEVVLAVLRGLPTFRPGSRPLRAWVLTIAQHKIIDAHRAGSRRGFEQVEDLYLPDPAPGPEERAERSDDAVRAGRLLDRLPARTREILVRRLVLGMSADEVAEAVGCSAVAVRVTQHRALAALRREAARSGGPCGDEPVGERAGPVLCGA